MYEQTGRYYAFFGTAAKIPPEEIRFFEHWTAGRRRAMDLGAGLCGPATMLARLGLDVLAVETSPELAALAVDRLNRGDDTERSVTLVEGPVETLSDAFAADVILKGFGFEVRQLYGAYDLDHPCDAGSPAMVAVAEFVGATSTDPRPGPGTK